MFGSGPFAYCACLDEMSDETYKKSIRHIEFDGDEYDVISYRKVAKEIEPSEFKRLEDRFKDSRIQYIRAMNSVVNCGFFSDVFRQIVKN